MLRGLTKVIHQVAADVPAVLWSPAAMRAMTSVVERFPEVKVKTVGPVRLGIVGLELRLAPGADQVDLTFPLLREDRDVIVAMGDDEVDGAWLREDPLWSRIWRFCRRWADPGTLVGQHVDLLWFELDVDGTDASGLPAPGVFIGFKPETTEQVDAGTWRRLLSEVLDTLTGAPPAEATLDHFEGSVGSLPPGACIRFFGLMLSRGGGAVRFVVGNLAEADVPGVLETIGWPGRPVDLADAVKQLTGPGGGGLQPRANSLQYDVSGASVLPRIGLEFALDRAVQAHRGIQEREFLRRLVERGFCDPDKCEALMQLPGETVAPYQDICMLGHARQVHHVKLVLDPGGPREAKAYYGRALVVRRMEGAAASPAGGEPRAGTPHPAPPASRPHAVA